MATVYTTEGAASYPVFQPMGQGQCGVAASCYTIASALSKNDIVTFFRLPPCSVLWGWFIATDIDTGTEAMEVDIGTSSDTDQLLDSGVLTGDVVTDVFGAHAALGQPNYRVLNGLQAGPVAYTSETTIIGTVVAAAAGGGTGYAYLGLFYKCA
jgi:hypothetical protein